MTFVRHLDDDDFPVISSCVFYFSLFFSLSVFFRKGIPSLRAEQRGASSAIDNARQSGKITRSHTFNAKKKKKKKRNVHVRRGRASY